jgi:hypothetical protein
MKTIVITQVGPTKNRETLPGVLDMSAMNGSKLSEIARLKHEFRVAMRIAHFASQPILL